MNDDSHKSGKDYSAGLNLPRTDFPMRAGLPEQEPKWLQFWEEIDLWGRLRKQSEGREKYILHDGPPYANGHLHIGHALNKILKDIVSRSQQMLGYDSHYVPGWDCHGLPIEWKIEEEYREKGLDKDAVDIVEFRRQCREFADKWVDIQRAEFKRLGVMGNWDNPYLTMDYKAEAIIAKEFCKFIMNGSLFRGEKPVLWSIVEKTALAEAEVEYKEHKSISLYVRFVVAECANADYVGVTIPIWTTTPWTIPCNRAIAYHNDVKYSLYAVTEAGEKTSFAVGEKFICADSLLESFCEVATIKAEKLAEVATDDLQGIITDHPLKELGYTHAVPLHHADFVEDSQGTGFVHVAPSHGPDDYYFGLAHGLDMPKTVTEDGHYTDLMPHFAGLTIYTDEGKDGTANGAVIKALAEAGGMLGKHSMWHSYPHSWRSKAPLIYRNTSQWFIGMEKNDLRKKALQAIDDTAFYPKQGKARLYDMIENRPDWCISRQRAWGVPLTLFVDKKTDEILQDDEVNEKIYDIFLQEGADAWFNRPSQDFLGDKYNADDYEKITDVLDVWFDSGSTHSFVLEQRGELKWPADLYLEGTDQHRGWFHSSLLVGCGTRGRAPYDGVLTHGFIMAEDGQKMSKSLGNIVTPQEVYDDLGADILRLWVVASNYYEELSIGPKILKQHSDSYRRFRNTWRFLLGNLHDFNPQTDKCDYKDLDALDKWVLHRLFVLGGHVRDYCKKYEFHNLFRDLHNFCTNELSALYFDIRKDRLYCEKTNGMKRRTTQTVLHEVFECLTGWLAPILCFSAEEAWQARRADLGNPDFMAESIHLCDFVEMPQEWKNEKVNAVVTEILDNTRNVVNAQIETMRKNKEIGSSLEVEIEATVTQDYIDKMKSVGITEEDLADYCIVSWFETEVGDVEKPIMQIGKAEGQKIEGGLEWEKCPRCWKVTDDIDRAREENLAQEVCIRCHSALHDPPRWKVL